MAAEGIKEVYWEFGVRVHSRCHLLTISLGARTLRAVRSAPGLSALRGSSGRAAIFRHNVAVTEDSIRLGLKRRRYDNLLPRAAAICSASHGMAAQAGGRDALQENAPAGCKLLHRGTLRTSQ